MTLGKLGKYELLENIGRGGFGIVYRARDSVLNVTRAVKVLHPAFLADPQFLERFRQEAQLAAQLEHPHIVPVYDLDEAQGAVFLVMKYMPGGSLKNLLDTEMRLPYERALEIARQVASALDYAHNRPEKFVHRDVKPGNILFEVDGTARLSDFGFAKALASASSSSLSASGGMVGTPAYMPPEVWRAKGVGPAADQYSLACVFFELITGKPLFAGESPAALVTQHVIEGPQMHPAWPSGAPSQLSDILGRALAKEPDARYPGILAFTAALAAHLNTGQNHIPEREPIAPIAPPAAPLPIREAVRIDSRPAATSPEEPAARTTLTKRSFLSRMAWGIILLLVFLGAGVSALIFWPKPSALPNVQGEPIILPKTAIDVSNAGRLQLLALWGDEKVLPINSVKWSPRGTWLFLRTNRGLNLYNANTFKLERVVQAGRLPVIAPDELTIASVAADGQTVKIQNLQSGAVKWELIGHQKPVVELFYSPDGALLVSRDDDYAIIRQAVDYAIVAEVRLHPDGGRCFLSQDNAYLVQARYGSEISLSVWLLDGMNPVEIPEFAGEEILELSADLTVMATWRDDGAILARRLLGDWGVISQLGEFATSEPNQRPQVTLSPNGEWAVVGQTLLRVETGETVMTGPFGYINVFDYLGRYLYSTDTPRGFQLWDLSTRAEISVEGNGILAQAGNSGGSYRPEDFFSPDGQKLFSGLVGPGQVIGVWDTAGGQLLETFNTDTGVGVLLTAFAAEASFITVDGTTIRLWDLTSGDRIQEINNPASADVRAFRDGLLVRESYEKYNLLDFPGLIPAGSITPPLPENCALINYFETSVSSGSTSAGALAYESGKLAREIHCGADFSDNQAFIEIFLDLSDSGILYPVPDGKQVEGLKFAPDGDSLAISLGDEIQVIATASQELRFTLVAETDVVRFTSLAFSPDASSFIAAGTNDGTVHLWDALDGVWMAKLATGTDWVYAVTFAPNDNHLLAVAGSDAVQLWDALRAYQLVSLEAIGTQTIAFSPDGALLASGSYQGEIRFWGAP